MSKFATGYVPPEVPDIMVSFRPKGHILLIDNEFNIWTFKDGWFKHDDAGGWVTADIKADSLSYLYYDKSDGRFCAVFAGTIVKNSPLGWGVIEKARSLVQVFASDDLNEFLFYDTDSPEETLKVKISASLSHISSSPVKLNEMDSE